MLWDWGSWSIVVEDSGLLGWKVVLLGEWFPVFRMMLPLSSKVNSPRKMYCLLLKMKAPWSLQIPGTTHPTLQSHIPENLHSWYCVPLSHVIKWRLYGAWLFYADSGAIHMWWIEIKIFCHVQIFMCKLMQSIASSVYFMWSFLLKICNTAESPFVSFEEHRLELQN
jgi:hypothetical protein